MPHTTSSERLAPAAETWIAFTKLGVKAGRYIVGLESHEGADEIFFSVPADFFVHDDSVAAALSTLCGRKYGEIRFEFPVSSSVRMAVCEQTGASVSATEEGVQRQPGRNLALNFSGGFDSFASFALLPEQVRVAVAFGGYFKRESDFFDKLSPEVVCKTDFREKGHERNDWMFMFAASLLFADYLGLRGIGLGTIFEATIYNYRFQKRSVQMPLFDALNLCDATIMRGLTEFGTARLILHYSPQFIDRSIESLAAPRSEKQLRKRLLVDATRHLAGGPPPDFERYEYPKRKLIYGDTYAVDFLALLFARLYGIEVVSRWIMGLEQVDPASLQAIDIAWIYKYNPLFEDDILPDVRARVIGRMRAAGIEAFEDGDWGHYRALREILAEQHSFPW